MDSFHLQPQQVSHVLESLLIEGRLLVLGLLEFELGDGHPGVLVHMAGRDSQHSARSTKLMIGNGLLHRATFDVGGRRTGATSTTATFLVDCCLVALLLHMAFTSGKSFLLTHVANHFAGVVRHLLRWSA